ncbi:MAG: SRPBCC family protein [Sporichthyaceae bacterium]|nr:SRPBCC family protein [Sporichthyaceae bacterium]
MTSTTHPETTISAVPDLPIVEIVREFDAPPEQVFRAHVDRDLFTQWIGPRDIDMRVEQWDARTGGSYRYVHGRGDEEFGFYGSFHEVRPNERIVQTFGFDGWPDAVSLEILTLEDLGSGRTRLRGQSIVESIEARDAMLASGMESGVVQGYEKLDDLLAG